MHGKGKQETKRNGNEEGAIQNQERTTTHEFVKVWHTQSSVSIRVLCNLKTNIHAYMTEVH